MAHPPPGPSGAAPAPPAAARPAPVRAPWTRWHQRASVRALIGAAVFVVGLFVGGIVVGFAVSGPTPPAPHVTITRIGQPPVAPSGSGRAVTGRAVVNAACLQAINESQSGYVGLRQLLDALRTLDAARIDQGLRSLQPLQTQLQRDLQSCRVTANAVEPVPRPSPTR